MTGPFDIERALPVAQEVAGWLEPVCTRVEIVGSLRRERPRVRDIDLLIIPKMSMVSPDLFDAARAEQAPALLSEELRVLDINERVHVRTNGPKYKRLVHCDSGIPIDLYLATMESWPTMLVIRTGSTAFIHKQLCASAHRKGLVLHADGSGIERVRGQTVRDRTTQPKSERGVFRVLGVPFCHPRERERNN